MNNSFRQECRQCLEEFDLYNDAELQFQHNICEQGCTLQRTTGKCIKTAQ